MAKKYEPTIGLEIHTELKTNTKMFCSCKNDLEEKRPNINVCPVCMAHPGTLPVMNKEAIKSVLKVGMALDGRIADYTEFDRKNYFYPDIPKGYQISQYKHPLVLGGELVGVKITRIHLEEDTAKSVHDRGDFSLIDYNRAGVPLMELVTEPVIKDGATAVKFAKELQLILRYLNVSDADMEKGQMRLETNISVSENKNKLGTKVEVKNLNSFRSVGLAIDYEIKRQTDVLERGEEIKQETRGWNENKQETFSQREKESSHDYRYFPEPDLPKLKISEIEEFSKKSLSKEIPELPSEKRERYKKEYGIKDENIEIYITNEKLRSLFEETIKEFKNNKNLIKLVSNYITSDIVGFSKGENGVVGKIEPKNLARMIEMIEESLISSRGAKDVLLMMYEKGGNPKEIAKSKNLLQVSDENRLKKIVEKVIKNNQKVIETYKNGNEASLQYLVGQGMKESGGSANPNALKKLIISALSS
ncbi:MAG: Asp-tRNA(Asn)/Glu-tRNA(Gln) amidotransferase subunit GatB [Candidatus Paceibacterota bacterium]